MKRPVVSVVIPAWNAREWIGDAVRSAVAQTDVPLEIIVVDDGSTDDTAAAARAAGGTHVQVIAQTNAGASAARNAGTAAVRGGFIQYLDADDVLLPGTIGRRLHRLEETSADVAYCDWVRWERDETGSFSDRETISRTLGPQPELELLGGCWWPPAALLYRRTIVDRIGPWRDDLPVIQDARFLQDAAFAGGTFVHVAGVGARYRVTGSTSLSRRDEQAFLDDCFRNAEMIEQRWAGKGVLTPPRRRELARVFAHVATASAASNRRQSDQAIARVLALDPEFLPDAGGSLRALAQLVGYRRAVRAAGLWHRGRSAVKTAS